jgi:vacuolar-type H+-ATPase subunit F/Vma7
MTDSNNKARVAAIGLKDVVQIFSAAAFDTFYTDTEDADSILERIAEKYALIVVTSPFSAKIAERYNEKPYPIILNLSKEAK